MFLLLVVLIHYVQTEKVVAGEARSIKASPFTPLQGLRQ